MASMFECGVQEGKCAAMKEAEGRIERAEAREHEQRLRANAAEERAAHPLYVTHVHGVSPSAAPREDQPVTVVNMHAAQTLGLVLAALGLSQDTSRATLLKAVEKNAATAAKVELERACQADREKLYDIARRSPLADIRALLRAAGEL